MVQSMNYESMAKKDLLERVAKTNKMIEEKLRTCTEEYKGVKIIRLSGDDFTLPIHSDSSYVSPRGYEAKILKGRKLGKRIEGILSYIKKSASCCMLHCEGDLCLLGNAGVIGPNGVIYCMYPKEENNIDSIGNQDMGSIIEGGVFSGSHMLANPFYADGTVNGIIKSSAAEYCEADIQNSDVMGVVYFEKNGSLDINDSYIEASKQISRWEKNSIYNCYRIR